MATERELLEAIGDRAVVYQRGKSESFEHDFAIAGLLNQRGYFMDFKVHRESQTAKREVDLFSIHHLSATGKARLAELQKADAQGEE